MGIDHKSFALNTLQWITVGLGATQESPGGVGWEFDRPSFLVKQPKVLAEVVQAGFASVMLEVLPTQTLQAYRRVVTDAGLAVAPGYVQVGLPEDYGLTLESGSDARFRWFDRLRRRAEESNYMGLDRVFLAADMAPGRPRVDGGAAIGYAYDFARLDRMANLIGESAEVLTAEGITPALHNHVGTWIETEAEYEYVLNAVPADLLSLGPDIGHLAWTGVDVVAWMGRHAARVSDVHIKDIDLRIAARSRERPTPYFDVMAQRFFLEPGLGGVPIVEALAQLPASFTGSVVVEVDKPTMEPLASAKVSWSWVEQHYRADARQCNGSEHDPVRRVAR